jgi:hypothetical protein
MNAPNGDGGGRVRRESATGIPRWVKVSVLVALLLAVLVVVVMLLGGGTHGPSRHSGAPASVPVFSQVR